MCSNIKQWEPKIKVKKEVVPDTESAKMWQIRFCCSFHPVILEMEQSKNRKRGLLATPA